MDVWHFQFQLQPWGRPLKKEDCLLPEAPGCRGISSCKGWRSNQDQDYWQKAGQLPACTRLKGALPRCDIIQQDRGWSWYLGTGCHGCRLKAGLTLLLRHEFWGLALNLRWWWGKGNLYVSWDNGYYFNVHYCTRFRVPNIRMPFL